MNKEAATKVILEEWITKQGHERCWYYPDLFNQLCKVYGISPPQNRGLPPLEEFKEGCAIYQLQEYGPEFPSLIIEPEKKEFPVYLL